MLANVNAGQPVPADHNNNLLLISGKSATGKSLSLMGLKNPEGVLYLGCENGKKLPFKSSFEEHVITDPYQVYQAFDYTETNPLIHTVVIDSATYLLDMYISLHVLTAPDTRSAWGEYGEYWKTLMSKYVARTKRNVIFTAHTLDVTNPVNGTVDTMVPVKGSLKNQGIESYFSTIVSTKKESLLTLEDYSSPLMNINEDEKLLKFKYVYQTKLTEGTVNERIRGPFGMWERNETYIDNNVQHVLDKFHTFYS